MRQTLAIMTFETNGKSLCEIREDVTRWLRETNMRMGILTLFSQHTSASLLITENASPEARRDLLRWLDLAVPEGDHYEHEAEGPDDMPAHIRAMLTGNSLTVPVADGRMMLGQWQSVYLAEHRAGTHRRSVVCHYTGL